MVLGTWLWVATLGAYSCRKARSSKHRGRLFTLVSSSAYFKRLRRAGPAFNQLFLFELVFILWVLWSCSVLSIDRGSKMCKCVNVYLVILLVYSQ